ncbi:hypothetical protein AB0C70_38155 [Streptomyces sp. NPDC048564]|uniref:hypothetical protein n=1 Tax=Streptomyces sp. NPDC048564 TaxID=3155760 RepID=UPI003435A18A
MNTPFSPAPRKRRRLILAALTANGAGAAVGAATQVAIGDPAISALVGGFVGGTVGDFLLQVARSRNEVPPDEVRTAAYGGRRGEDGPASHRELANRHGRVGGARPTSVRCTRSHRQDGVLGAPQGLQLPQAVTPRHLRHRQLHRGAQRFARRARERHAVRQQHGGTHGAS